jgi:hypothetical protein
MEERTDAAMLLLKGLNPLQAKADEDGFKFLSYLLRMAVLEAQAIASGSNGEVERPPCDAEDSSYDAGTPGDVTSPNYESRC